MCRPEAVRQPSLSATNETSSTYDHARIELASESSKKHKNIPANESSQKCKGPARFLQRDRGRGVPIGGGEVASGNRDERQFNEDEDENIDHVGGEGCHKVGQNEDRPDWRGDRLLVVSLEHLEVSRTDHEEAQCVVELLGIIAIGSSNSE